MKRIKNTALILMAMILATSLFACGGKTDKEETKLTAQEIVEKLLPIYGEVPLEDNSKVMADSYTFDKEKPKSYAIYSPMMNTMASELVVIQAANKEDAAQFKTDMESRHKDNVTTWERYLPDQYELVKKFYLEQKGNYVIYAIGENVEKVKTEFNNLVK